MMKTIYILLFFVLSLRGNAQIINSMLLNDDGVRVDKTLKDGFFSGGNLDFGSGSVLQGSADVISLELDAFKITIPAILKVGSVSDLSSTSEDLNNDVTNDIHSNYGGVVVFGVNSVDLIGNADNNGLKIPFFLGTKMISGLDSMNLEKVNFFNLQSNLGILYKNNARAAGANGKYWLLASFSSFLGNENSMQRIFGINTETFLLGANFEFGIDISKIVNFRLGYYKYFNNDSISEFDDGVFKVAFNFSNL